MKIKLLSREITLTKVDENAKRLGVKYDGVTTWENDEIYFNGNDPFSTLLHEITHIYLYYTGNDMRKNYSEEDICDIFGKLIEQLMLENGDDIIKKLKEFAIDKN